jgi:hypothetical protein
MTEPSEESSLQHNGLHHFVSTFRTLPVAYGRSRSSQARALVYYASRAIAAVQRPEHRCPSAALRASQNRRTDYPTIGEWRQVLHPTGTASACGSMPLLFTVPVENMCSGRSVSVRPCMKSLCPCLTLSPRHSAFWMANPSSRGEALSS